jgi:hypothetical protein
MVPRAPDGRPHPPTTAVVQVAEDGRATLYLGTELVEHAVGVDAAGVMRELIDYAATLDAAVRVTTQMPDGTWMRHVVYADGTLTAVPRKMPRARSTAGVPRSADERLMQRPTRWTGAGAKLLTHGRLLVLLLFLATALLVITLGTDR